MDCEHRDQLLDLVYGELEDAEATVLRRQAEACDGCRDELARLESAKRLADQLVVEPMPLTAHNLILAAAREAAAKKAQPEPEKSWWAGVLTWIQETAAKPQLAMAVVMLGVVAVGVYFVPGDELAQQEIEESLVADPETETETETEPEETEASNETQTELDAPIEPETELEVADDPPLDTDALERDANQARPDEPVRRDPPTTMRTTPTRETSMRRRPTPDQIAAARQEARDLDLEGTMLDLNDIAEEAAEQQQIAPEPAPQNVDESMPPPAVTAETRRPETETRRPQPQSNRTGESVNTIEPMRGNRATYQRAMSEYRQRDFRAAAEEFERVVRSPDEDVRELLPSALHHLARSHRSRGACGTALQHFNRLFERFPAYAQLPQALLEAADCHRRQGSLRDARLLLTRAAGYASTQAAAERELQRIETLQRAQRRAAPAPAQADSMESAY